MAEAAGWHATGRADLPRRAAAAAPHQPSGWAGPSAQPLAAATAAPIGAAAGGVRTVLRAEGLALLVASTWAYAQFMPASWGFFAALFLLPDLALLAYLAGRRAGTAAYNASHSTLAPLALAGGGVLAASPSLLALGLVWGAHVGFDRALGFGLKYSAGFAHTHLGQIGRPDPW